MTPELSLRGAAFLRDYFALDSLAALRRVPQADKVLALLRGGHLQDAERLVGKPIERLPPDPRLDPLPHAPLPVRDHPVVVRKAQNPCLPTTDLFRRYNLIQRGMTVDQLLRRGLTRRDLRRLIRAGHLEIR